MKSGATSVESQVEMSSDDVGLLASLLNRERDILLTKWRQQVRELPSARHLDIPTLNDHIPRLLDELASALRVKSDQTIPESLAEGSAPFHGVQRLQDAFDIVEVVAEYNILRGCIHDLADSNGFIMQGRSFHIMNRVLDGAIGLAVEAYATQQALEVQMRREEHLSFIAHDLRTPLNAISFSTRVLELTVSETGRNPEAERIFRVLRRSVDQLSNLISKILEESVNLQTETGIKLERREFDLWPLVEALIYDLRPVAGTGSTLLINEIPVDLVVYADASLLRRVFQNLIANAISYTPRGEIVIGASEADANGVECWVSDNGAGIPQDRVARIFEKFETDPEKEGGTGLGLAIVKTFIEAHDGKVTVDSKENVGTTFRFTLPAKT